MSELTVTRDELRPFIKGTAFEVEDAAHALAASVMPDPLRGVEVDVFRLAFDGGFGGDYKATGSASPPEARRALMRLAARCLALLALDEIVRGSDAIEGEGDASEVFG